MYLYLSSDLRQESRADSAGYLAPEETARIASEYLTAPHHSP